MNDPIDTHLKALALAPPADFTERMMQRLDALPLPSLELPHLAAARPAAHVTSGPRWWAWIFLAGGALAGALELAGFMFGIWLAGAAG